MTWNGYFQEIVLWFILNGHIHVFGHQTSRYLDHRLWLAMKTLFEDSDQNRSCQAFSVIFHRWLIFPLLQQILAIWRGCSDKCYLMLNSRIGFVNGLWRRFGMISQLFEQVNVFICFVDNEGALCVHSIDQCLDSQKFLVQFLLCHFEQSYGISLSRFRKFWDRGIVFSALGDIQRDFHLQRTIRKYRLSARIPLRYMRRIELARSCYFDK